MMTETGSSGQPGRRLFPERRRFSSVRWFLAAAVGTGLSVMEAAAVTFTSVPTFSPTTNAPLAGVLRVSTDVPSRLSVEVNDGTGIRTRKFYDFATNHVQPLYGFRPGLTNEITVTVYDQGHNAATVDDPVIFVTNPLPTQFPVISLLRSQPSLMEPGYTLFMVQVHGGQSWWGVIVDATGHVVWYSVVPSTLDLRQLANGDLFMPATTSFYEVNLLGQIVKSWPAPNGMTINEHEGLPTDHGTILYLSDFTETVKNYPTSMTVQSAPRTNATVVYQKVLEISQTNSALLHTWSPITQLEANRISYLIGQIPGGWDSEHSNALVEDPSDNSIIVSMRHQNAVIKFSRATGNLVWILGPPANWGAAWQKYLLQPIGTPFIWSYGQHSPVLTPQGTLLLYDNGNYRASPYTTAVPNNTNYSRAVEYSIDEQNMTVAQVWDYGRTNVAQVLFTDHEGNAEVEPVTGNVLIDFANVDYVNGQAPSVYGTSASMVRLTEVTHTTTPEIVFDLSISMYSNTNSIWKDCSVYRCHRIPDLYGHPAMPVGDLRISYPTGVSLLQFSGDDFRTYLVQASPDLMSWETIGQGAETSPGSGDYLFQEDMGTGAQARYYRVLTQ